MISICFSFPNLNISFNNKSPVFESDFDFFSKLITSSLNKSKAIAADALYLRADFK